MDSDYLSGYSRAVALDDFDEPSSESESELAMTASEREKSEKPPALPAWVAWNPLIAENLLKPDGPRLDTKYLIIGLGQRACDILESIIDIDKLIVNGSLFMPQNTHACRPKQVAAARAQEPLRWTPLVQPHSSPNTDFIYTTVDLAGAVGLFHTVGNDDRRSGSSGADSYPAGSSLARQMLDGSFNVASLGNVVILQVLPADRYIGDRPASDLLSAPVARYLHTTTYNGPELNPIVELEPPNLVSGFGADLLCRCELIRQSATLLTCYSDAPALEILDTVYTPLFRLLSKSIFFTVRFKDEAAGVSRKIRSKFRKHEDDDLAGLYL